MEWLKFWRPGINLKQNFFKKAYENLKFIYDASFGTLCIQIGQTFEKIRWLLGFCFESVEMSISIEYQCGPYNVCGQFGRKETLLNGLQVFIIFFKNVVFYVNAFKKYS